MIILKIRKDGEHIIPVYPPAGMSFGKALQMLNFTRESGVIFEIDYSEATEEEERLWREVMRGRRASNSLKGEDIDQS